MIRSGAIFSACRRYRYTLSRDGIQLGPDRGRVVFIMLNPSTADEHTNDPTVARCIDYARRWGFASLTVLNAYAWRATLPKDMFAAAGTGIDIVGPVNDEWIHDTIRADACDQVVVAWGVHATVERVTRLRALFAAADREVSCLGKNEDGSPKHPLYLRKTQPLKAWP